MSALVVPSATAAPIDHADWLELEAIRAADRNSSLQDLASALRRTGSSEEIEDEAGGVFFEDENDEDLGDDRESHEPDRGGETSEPVAESAFVEIEDRASGCDGGYPFAVDAFALQGKRSLQDSAYIFMLLLSTFGKNAAPDGFNAPQLFEEICEVAIANCLGGERNAVQTYQFGFPRRIGPPGFKAALDDLCQQTGEGAGAKGRPDQGDYKDAALDLVAWRAFPDQRRGILMVWGQCATGANWRDKLTEMQPDRWANYWMYEQPAVPPVRAFFVPHRVDQERWYHFALNGGMLFDRCRIAAFARPLPPELKERCKEFNRHVIAQKVRA